jgi:hypothetical protein
MECVPFPLSYIKVELTVSAVIRDRLIQWAHRITIPSFNLKTEIEPPSKTSAAFTVQ